MKKRSIDFYIIWKKFHAKLTENEDEEFQRWLNESSHHKGLVKDAEVFYKEGSSFTNLPADKAVAFNNVQNRINRKRFIIRSVASVAAIFLAGIFSYILINTKSSNEIAKNHTESIHFTKTKQTATLILGNGIEQSVTAHSSIQIEQGNAKVKQQGRGLSYVNTGKKLETLVFNTLIVERGNEFFIELSDHTKVWLNSETSLRYPVSFGEDERTVELTGEAYFEVSKDSKRPFRVISNNHKIEVLGTQFNVSSYQNDLSIKTTLVEGSVKINAGDNKAVILQPNFQSLYNPTEGNVSTQKVDVEEFVAWRKGLFYFKNQPLEQMMKTLERWYDVKVEFKDNSCKGVEFTGKIKRYESLSKVLSTIEETNEIIFEEDQETIYIISK